MTRKEIRYALYEAQSRYDTDNINALVFKNNYSKKQLNNIVQDIDNDINREVHQIALGNLIDETIKTINLRVFNQ